MQINVQFSFWSRGHLRVVVLHLYTKFHANIINRFTKFNWESRETTYEGLFMMATPSL